MSDIPIEEINETIPEGDGSGFLLLVGIVGLIVLLWYQAFPKNQQNNENNQHQQGDQDEPNQRLSALECVKLFFTKGLNGMCFPMIEDDENENEEEQAREHAD